MHRRNPLRQKKARQPYTCFTGATRRVLLPGTADAGALIASHFVRLTAPLSAVGLANEGIRMRNSSSSPLDLPDRPVRSPVPGGPLRSVLAVAALAFAGVTWAADIAEIYAEAVENDPVLAGQRASNASLKVGVDIARSSLLPQVSANAGRSRGTSSVDSVDMNPASPTFGQPTPDRNFTSQNWGTGVNQTVLNMQTWFGYRSAKARAKQADWDLEDAAQSLITRVALAYLNVLTRQASLESTKAAEEAVRRQLEQVQQRFDVGLEAITGVLESKAAYDRAVETRIQAESDHWISFEALRTLTGVGYDEIADLKPDLPIIDPQPNDEEEWVRTAMAENYRIRSAKESLASAELQVKNQMAGRLPTISAGASYGSNSGESSINGFVLPNQGTSTSVSYRLNLSVPLFQGMRTHASIKQARLNREQARQALIAQELTVAEQVRTRFRSVVTDVVRVAARAEAIKSSEAALQATQTGYEVGTRNIVEVLQAQQQLFLTQFNYQQTRHNYVLNMLLLKESAGILNAADVAEINGHMDPASPVRKGR